MSFNVDIKEEMVEMKEDIKRLQSESLAYEMLKDSVKASKRKDGIIVLLIVLLTCSVVYTIYLLNDIIVIETNETSEIVENESYDINQTSGDGGNNNFINGSNNEVHN